MKTWQWVAMASLLAGADASASVDRIQVQSREPFYVSRIGPYTKIGGTFTGSLEPAEERIPNLANAKRRADGRVEYTSDFIILMPEGTAGNRVLLFDVENNGRPVVHGMYNSPLESIVRGLETGNGFLEDEGFIIAVASWQGGQGITLPEYIGTDGKSVPLPAAGFAALRDFAAFLRFDTKDRAGTPNPVAGRIDLAVAAGSSQTSRMLKSFLFHGFNQANRRRVFDAMHLHVGQVGTMPFIPPAEADPDVVKAALVGDSAVFPFTYGELLAPVAERKEAPPKILATNVEGDYFRRRLSLLRTGARGVTERPVADTIRVWDITGASHGIVLTDDCDMPRANLDWHPLLRAGLMSLVRWARGGEPPPATQLLPLTTTTAAPFISEAPSDQREAVIMVPRRDADGNAVEGVRLPAVEVPLGTFGGWNAPLDNNCADQSTFFHAFARTKWQRLMTRDERPSLEERYRGAADYVQRYREAAEALVRQGYLLKDDATAMVTAAEAKAPGKFKSGS